MNLQDEINKIKNEMLDEFDKRVEALKEDEQEFPQDGDEYYVLTATGLVVQYIWCDGNVDSKTQVIGNVFRTEQEAHFAVEKLKVEAELRKFSRPFEIGGFNYCILGDLEEGRVDVMCRAYLPTQGTIYFESAEKAQQAIESVGEDRIKKYIFGVED